MLNLRRTWIVASLSGAILLAGGAFVSPSSVQGGTYDGTNPAATTCWNSRVRVSSRDIKHIVSGSVIGQVELWQSLGCGTVWSQVVNQTEGYVQAREQITLYDNPNGPGYGARTASYLYPTADTLAPRGQAQDRGWSNQYRNPQWVAGSFMAEGSIYVNGYWSPGQTLRSPKWVQFTSFIPNDPWSCVHTSYQPCYRWAVKSAGVSSTIYYDIDPSVRTLQGKGSPYYDASGDVKTMFDKYNALAGTPNPFVLPWTPGIPYHPVPEIHVYTGWEAPSGGFTVLARGGAQPSPEGIPGIYYSGTLMFNTYYTLQWGPSSDVQALLCHEIGHVEGLAHITVTSSNGEIQGTRLSCMGNSNPNGPMMDDVDAFNNIYRSSVP